MIRSRARTEPHCVYCCDKATSDPFLQLLPADSLNFIIPIMCLWHLPQRSCLYLNGIEHPPETMVDWGIYTYWDPFSGRLKFVRLDWIPLNPIKPHQTPLNPIKPTQFPLNPFKQFPFTKGHNVATSCRQWLQLAAGCYVAQSGCRREWRRGVVERNGKGLFTKTAIG